MVGSMDFWRRVDYDDGAERKTGDTLEPSSDAAEYTRHEAKTCISMRGWTEDVIVLSERENERNRDAGVAQ